MALQQPAQPHAVPGHHRLGVGGKPVGEGREEVLQVHFGLRPHEARPQHVRGEGLHVERAHGAREHGRHLDVALHSAHIVA